MSGCFISYRRDDSGPWAGRLRDRLVADFPQTKIFFDVDSIELGHDFRTVIDSTLHECNVVLVLIGPTWLEAGADGRRRIDDVNDVHRVEVARALAADVRVIPVLVGGATMPAAEDLPAELQVLSFRNALAIDHGSFSRDVDLLEQNLRRIDGFDSAPAPAPVAVVAAEAATATSQARSKLPLLIGLAVVAIVAVVGVVIVSSGGSDGGEAATTSTSTASTTTAAASSAGAVILPPVGKVYEQTPDDAAVALEKVGLDVFVGDWECSTTVDVGLVRQLTWGEDPAGPVLIGKPGEAVDEEVIADLRIGDPVTVWVVDSNDC